MKKIKLLHVISNLERGGAQAVLYSLLTHLDNQQFEHHVIYFRHGPYVEQIKQLGIPAYQIKGGLCLYDPLFFIRFMRLVKQLQPDCIHSLLWAANAVSRIAAKLLHIPLVSVIHNNVEQDGVIRYIIDYVSLGFSNSYVAVSDGARTSFIKRYPWFNTIKVIKNGIDIQDLMRLTSTSTISRHQLGIPDDAFVIGSVGRFEAVKNYRLLIKSCAVLIQRNSQIHLLLIGSGSQEKMLREDVQQLGLSNNVTFVVGKPSYSYLSIFDCFAMSSDKEGISMALLEAMACGLVPVVTSADIKHPVIQSGVNGFVVPAGDTQKLTDKLEQVVDVKNEMGIQASRTIANYFNHKNMLQAYSSFFLERAVDKKTL